MPFLLFLIHVVAQATVCYSTAIFKECSSPSRSMANLNSIKDSIVYAASMVRALEPVLPRSSNQKGKQHVSQKSVHRRTSKQPEFR
jgi:hypothetical protein